MSGLAVGALLVGGTLLLAGRRARRSGDHRPRAPAAPRADAADADRAHRPAPEAPSRPVPAQPQRPALRNAGPELDVVARTNVERLRAGCGPLRVDSRLTAAAREHSADMVDRRYFEHDSPDGSSPEDRASAAGYADYGGENLAYGQGSAAEVVADWMGSPDHRRNILDCEFTTSGVGLDPRGMYWTQDFGY